MKALLKDVDMSLLRHKIMHTDNLVKSPRELEVYPNDFEALEEYMSSEELDSPEGEDDGKLTRKSPAALLGSQRIGAVILPLELRTTITNLISGPYFLGTPRLRLTICTGTDKPMLHVDAKRLFLDESENGAEWDTTYDVRYKTREQRARHAERDGTAFASVALPAHYSAIFSVLDHLKQRLGPDWSIQHVIDWGAGTASGLW